MRSYTQAKHVMHSYSTVHVEKDKVLVRYACTFEKSRFILSFSMIIHILHSRMVAKNYN